jgi:hypothetical protein
MSILTPGQLQRIRKFEEGGAAGDQPYVASVTRQDQFMDPLTQQLLYGTDGQDGFIPGAFRAAERTFFDSEGRPIVIPQEIAGLSPDQIQAQQLARGAVGVQQPFIQEAMSRGQLGIDALKSGIGGQSLASQQALRQIQEGSRFALDQRDRAMMDAIGGTQQGRARALEAEARLRGDLGDITGMAQRSTGQYIDQLGQQAAQGRRATEDFGMDLAKARQQGRTTYDEFGRDLTDSFGMAARGREDLARGLAGGQDLSAQSTAGQRARLALAEEGLQSGISDLSGNLTDSVGMRMIGQQGLSRDLARSEQLASAAGASQRARLGLAETGMKGGISQLDRDLTRQLGAESAVTGGFGGQIGEARTQLKNTVEDGFNIGDKTSEYFDPFEDLVVQQAIRDASEGLAKQDMSQYARDISSGGESAFGSRARLSAEERAEAMGRGLAREVGGIRSAGFQRAQQTAIGEDERARQARRTASSGLASLAGQELGAERGLIDRAAQASQQRYGAAQNLAGMQQQRAASELGSSRELASMLGQTAQQRYGAGESVASAAAQAAQQQYGASQDLAGMRQQRAANELASGNQLADVYRQGAQQMYGADQALAGQAQQIAQQKQSAGQGYGNLIQQTAQAQLSAQQQQNQQMGQQAQQQYGAQQGLGSLMGGAAQQLYGAGTGLGQTLAGYGQQDAAARAAAAQQGMGVAGTLANQYGQIGQQQYGAGQALAGAQQGYGGFLSGLGGQAQQAAQQDVASLQGIGGQAQQQRQRELDAQRAGLLQAQQAPLAQYQALMPFVNMSPAGTSSVQMQYTPPPSALQAGIGTGLATLGALGKWNNPNSELRPRLTPD